uniref:EF-hand domain-containing protein n=1 Tax=Arcella intermedia TaxID=1963864 RepID=A0A6B2LQV0_9EUKA
MTLWSSRGLAGGRTARWRSGSSTCLINNDGHVNFEEFVSGLAIFKSGSTEEKLKFSFRLYDVDGDGFIQKKELLEMLRASLLENCTLNLSSSQLERILVTSTRSPSRSELKSCFCWPPLERIRIQRIPPTWAGWTLGN